MPDLTDMYSEEIREALKVFVNRTPKTRLTDDDYTTFINQTPSTREMQKRINALDADGLRTSYFEHLKRDATNRAIQTIRAIGSRRVRRLFANELDQPGLWTPDSAEYFGRDGVWTMQDNDGRSYDVPLRHLHALTTARHEDEWSKHALDEATTVQRGVRAVLDLEILTESSTITDYGDIIQRAIAESA
jgi:hypothetical protein